MAATSANYVFLPWVRQGAAAGIQTPDSLGAGQAGAISIALTLRLNTGDTVPQTARLLGPGDVTGIDPQQIVRREPRDHATDFEPNYFPAIEFDRPDFPWLFTPAKALADGKLRPWLCLVIVRRQEGVTLRDNGTSRVLDIRAPARPDRELPDLDESWAWAHAQITGAARNAGALAQALGGDPALTVSRLVCPRRLDPLTSYLACLVPAFELGRKAGLGEAIATSDESALAPAWTHEQPAVTLPVFDQWEFRTGQGGDFESLVRLLEARKLPEAAGKLVIDISQSGLRMDPAPAPGTTLDMQGALRVIKAPLAWPPATQAAFVTAIAPVLDAPAKALSAGTDPLLAPPIHGCWQAARRTVILAPATQTWLDDLNLDPRHRATAALGTQVVQAQQELLMAAAWEQLGDIQRVNQIRRQAQLARSVNAVYHDKHFKRLSSEALLKIAGPAQSRLVIQTPGPSNTPKRTLLSHSVATSALPVTAISAPLRRMTSPRSTVSARFFARSAVRVGVLSRLNATASAPAPSGGLVTMNRVSDQRTTALTQSVRFENIAPTLTRGPGLGRFKIAAEGDVFAVLAGVLPISAGTSPVGLPDNADAQAFRTAARGHMQYLAGLTPGVAARPAPMDFATTRAAVLTSLDPAVTIAARTHASVAVAGAAPPHGDPLQPILDAPVFPQPMYEALRDLSQDFLFPGLDQVPANTVTLLETNPAFIEAFLVGLNGEMSHELLWRGYPTDQRGTSFRQFWERLGGNAQSDIDAISTWRNRRLGQNLHAGEELVLLIRGELLRRYPNAVIYAVAAISKAGQLDLSPDVSNERHPLFRGTLRPDITFLGFDLKKEDAVGNPGWFFVIQEQPTEPRFGLDAADYAKPLPQLGTWNDMSWRHLADTPEKLAALSHASARTPLPTIDRVSWGRNGGHQAFITLQRPVRIAIHARDMIAT